MLYEQSDSCIKRLTICDRYIDEAMRPNEYMYCYESDYNKIARDAITNVISTFDKCVDVDFADIYANLSMIEEGDLLGGIKMSKNIADQLNENYMTITTKLTTLLRKVESKFMLDLITQVTKYFTKHYSSKIVVYFFVGLGGSRLDLMLPPFILDAIKHDNYHHLIINICRLNNDEAKRFYPMTPSKHATMYDTPHHNIKYYQLIDSVKDYQHKFSIVSIYGTDFMLGDLDQAMDILSILNPSCVMFHWGVRGYGIYDNNEKDLVIPLFEKYSFFKVYDVQGIFSNGAEFVSGINNTKYVRIEQNEQCGQYDSYLNTNTQHPGKNE